MPLHVQVGLRSTRRSLLAVKGRHMRTYQIIVTMPDGQQNKHTGIFECGVDAAIDAMEKFPEARRISARRIP